MADLSSAARDALVRARRGAPSAGEAVRARVRQRVDAALASTTSDPVSYAGSGRQLFLTKLALLSGVLLIGAAALRWGSATPAPVAPPPSPTPATLSAALPLAPVSADGSSGTVPAARNARSEASVPPTPAPSASYALAAEVQLLDRATQRLFEGDSLAARKLLDAHRRRFRRPQLLQERTGLTLLADCMEDAPRAKASAMAFLRGNPAGVLTARIERACGLDDGT